MDEYVCSETNKLMIAKIVNYTNNPFDGPLLFQYYAQFKKTRITLKNLDKSTKFWNVSPTNNDWEVSELSAFISINLYHCSKEYVFPLTEMCEDVNTNTRTAVYKLANNSLWNYNIYDEIKSEYEIKRIVLRVLEIVEFLHFNGIVDLDCFNIYNIYVSDDCTLEDIPKTLKFNLFEALEERERELTMIPPEKFIDNIWSETNLWLIRNRNVKTDLYRVGIIVFLLLFKKDPFDGLSKQSFVEIISKNDFKVNFNGFDVNGISSDGLDFISKLLCPISERADLETIKSHSWLGLCHCSSQEFLLITKDKDSYLKKLPVDVIHYLMKNLIFYETPTYQTSEDMKNLINKLYSEIRSTLDRNSQT